MIFWLGNTGGMGLGLQNGSYFEEDIFKVMSSSIENLHFDLILLKFVLQVSVDNKQFATSAYCS